jgi:PKD repeat protein
VTDNDGAEAIVEHAVTVLAQNQRPTAEFSSTCTNLDCQFTDQSTDPDGTIVSWSWEFEGGGSSTLQNPTHSFGGTGTYKVRLTVTDDRGESRSTDHDVSVTAPPPPNQEPTAAFSSFCDGALNCTFTDASSDPNGNETITGWSWDFGDPGSAENTSGQQNPQHTYPGAGDYTVTLTVTDDGGNTGSSVQTISVPTP